MISIRFYLSISCLLLAAASLHNATAADYTVTFQTTECNGDKGFASVPMEAIWRMSSIECRSPDNPDEKLMQLLVRSNNEQTTYDVYRITPGDGARIQQQINRYMEAKTRALENSDNHNIHIDRRRY